MPARSLIATMLLSSLAVAAPPTKPVCRSAVIEGELDAGQQFSQIIGGGLKVYFQPIHSGWILRVLPISGPAPEHDYAELATPPYQSVTPLSISTDFAFRAQDAVGWNPRRFHFATSAASFQRLNHLYAKVVGRGSEATVDGGSALATELSKTSEGTFTILDSRLVPGAADQWQAAGAVASHFDSTAHTLVQEPVSPLGRIIWLRFRLQLDIPQGFSVNPALHLQSRPCAAP
jgi:hypothetical protein